MGGLAHYIEAEGVPTTQVSLIRLHTEKIRPSRALWVPFELGRPLGAPGDAAFQKRVLRAVLGLLERPDGPVILEDYGEEAPADLAVCGEGEGWACPVNLPPPPADLDAGGGFRTALEEEVRRLAPWYDMALETNGRTSVGLSGRDMAGVVDLMSRMLDGEVPDVSAEDLSLMESVRFAADDLKAFYREAAAARPGASTGEQLNDWFYGDTVAGRALLALRPIVVDLGRRRDDAALERFGQALLIPLSQRHRLPAN